MNELIGIGNHISHGFTNKVNSICFFEITVLTGQENKLARIKAVQ